MSAPLSMAQAAAAVGLTYEAFRKRWKGLRRDTGFPSPFLTAPYQWRPEAIEAWKLNREAGDRHAPAPANDTAALARREPPQVAQGRSRILQLMGSR